VGKEVNRTYQGLENIKSTKKKKTPTGWGPPRYVGKEGTQGGKSRKKNLNIFPNRGESVCNRGNQVLRVGGRGGMSNESFLENSSGFKEKLKKIDFKKKSPRN